MSDVIATKPCTSGDKVYDNAESWRDRCNTCTCDQGKIRCTQMTCAPSNCFDQETRSNCTCLKKPDADCITPPCRGWGECANNLAIRGGPGLCVPDMGSERLSSSCAKVVIAFHIALLPAVSPHFDTQTLNVFLSHSWHNCSIIEPSYV